jgi:hypothetical protein
MENLVDKIEEINRARNAMLSQGARCAEHVLGLVIDPTCPKAKDPESCPRYVTLENQFKVLSNEFSVEVDDRHSFSNIVE